MSVSIRSQTPIDAGGFDTRFPGIRLNISEGAWNRVLHLQLLYPDWQLEESFLGDIGSPEDIIKTCYSTVAIHEATHYVDHLLSPVGCAITRARLNIAIFTQFFLNEVRPLENENAVRVLPAPLNKWFALPLEKRRRIAADLSNLATFKLNGADFSIPLFLFADLETQPFEQFAEYFDLWKMPSNDYLSPLKNAEVCLYNFRRIKSLIESEIEEVACSVGKIYISQESIYEANAILAQIGEAAHFFGDSFAIELLNDFLKPPFDNYNSALIYLYETNFLELGGRKRIDTIAWSYLLRWSMLGSPEYGGLDGTSPQTRLVRLCKNLDQPFTSDLLRGSVGDLFDFFDKVAGVVPFREHLAAKKQASRWLEAFIGKLLASLATGKGKFQAFETAAIRHCEQVRVLDRYLAKRPDVMCTPGRLFSGRYLYPTPIFDDVDTPDALVTLSAGDYFILEDDEFLESLIPFLRGFDTVRGRDGTPRVGIYEFYAPIKDRTQESLFDKDFYTTTLNLADVLFDRGFYSQISRHTSDGIRLMTDANNVEIFDIEDLL